MKVTYRERHFIDRYSCIDYTRTFYAESYWIPSGTSMYYFRLNQFNVKTVAKEDIISIENLGAH